VTELSLECLSGNTSGRLQLKKKISILPHISLQLLHRKMLKITTVYRNEISILNDKTFYHRQFVTNLVNFDLIFVQCRSCTQARTHARARVHTYTMELNSANRLQWRLPLPEFNRSTWALSKMKHVDGRTWQMHCEFMPYTSFKKRIKSFPFPAFLSCCVCLSVCLVTQ